MSSFTTFFFIKNIFQAPKLFESLMKECPPTQHWLWSSFSCVTIWSEHSYLFTIYNQIDNEHALV